MAKLIFSEMDAPQWYAGYYFNADKDGYTAHEIADADATLGDWEVCSVKGDDSDDGEWETFYGEHDGLMCTMVTYIICREMQS